MGNRRNYTRTRKKNKHSKAIRDFYARKRLNCDQDNGIKLKKRQSSSGKRFENRPSVPSQRPITISTCDICLKIFDNRRSLVEHKKEHARESQYKCPKCKYIFESTFRLQNHMCVNSSQKKPSTRANSLRKNALSLGPGAKISATLRHKSGINFGAHMIQHTRQNTCSLCHKTFVNEQFLIQHMKVHIGQTSHKCTKCRRYFETACLLKRHLDFHERQKIGASKRGSKTTCAICRRKLLNRQCLNDHMKLHNRSSSSNNAFVLQRKTLAVHGAPNYEPRQNPLASSVPQNNVSEALPDSSSAAKSLLSSSTVKDTLMNPAIQACNGDSEETVCKTEPYFLESESEENENEKQVYGYISEEPVVNQETNLVIFPVDQTHLYENLVDTCDSPTYEHRKADSEIRGTVHDKDGHFTVGVCKSEEFVTNLLPGAHDNSEPVPDSDQEEPNECELCQIVFQNPAALLEHLNDHENDVELQYNSDSELLPGAPQQLRRRHVCKICKKTFSKYENLNEHYMIHNGEMQHRCYMCYKTYLKSTDYRRHCISAHNIIKPFWCDICDMSFPHFKNLKAHAIWCTS